MNKYLSILIVFVCACTATQKTTTVHPYTGDSVGCGNFIIYKLTPDKREYLAVIVDASALDLEAMQAFAIGKAEVVKVYRKKFDAPVAHLLCNDVVGERPKEILEEEAISGIVEVRLSKNELEKARKREGYHVDVTLKKVMFQTQAIDALFIDDVYVGWLPG